MHIIHIGDRGSEQRASAVVSATKARNGAKRLDAQQLIVDVLHEATPEPVPRRIQRGGPSDNTNSENSVEKVNNV